MNIFEQVKESITTKQAAMHYGMNVNQNDMVCCPFHTVTNYVTLLQN